MFTYESLSGGDAELHFSLGIGFISPIGGVYRDQPDASRFLDRAKGIIANKEYYTVDLRNVI